MLYLCLAFLLQQISVSSVGPLVSLLTQHLMVNKIMELVSGNTTVRYHTKLFPSWLGLHVYKASRSARFCNITFSIMCLHK
jgi:hypothetical protein